MLYDCKAEAVRLEKEIEIIKNYIDLEKDRYGNRDRNIMERRRLYQG